MENDDEMLDARLAEVEEGTRLFKEHETIMKAMKAGFAIAAEPLDAVKLPPNACPPDARKHAAHVCRELNITRHQFEVLSYGRQSHKKQKIDHADEAFLKSRCNQFMNILSGYRAIWKRLENLFSRIGVQPYDGCAIEEITKLNAEHRQLNAEMKAFADKLPAARENNVKAANVLKRIFVTTIRPGEEHWVNIDDKKRRAMIAYQKSQQPIDTK